MSSNAARESERLATESPGETKHQEKTLHPERFEDVLPRRRAHIILIRWTRSADGEWSYECQGGQFEIAHDRIWTVSRGEELRDYDMSVWSICAS